MSEEYLFTHDGAVQAYDAVDVDGITVDDDGSADFNWSEIPVVDLGEPPHRTAFDSERFYKIEGATVARPIKQPYRVGDSIKTFKKPADELRDAAWSADNKPYPLTHPDTGMVKSVDDIHGFWKNPRYDDEDDRLKADLYVPENDEDAREFIAEHQDVSIGFYNRVHSEYDGDTGDLTDDDVDGFQTDLYIDHIAGVKRGRCSGEEGCGLDHDESDHGEVVMETTNPRMGQDEADSADSGGRESATHGDSGPNRVDSDPRGVEKGPDAQEDCGPCTSNMSNDDDNFDIQVDLDDLSLDSLEEKFDEVAELRADYNDLAESMDEIRDDLDEHGFDVEADECPCEVVDDVLHDFEEMQETIDALEEVERLADADDPAEEVKEMVDALEDYESDEKEEALDELTSFGADRDEWEDASLDEIREEIDRREEVLDEAELDTKGIDTDNDDSEDVETDINGRRRFGRGYSA